MEKKSQNETFESWTTELNAFTKSWRKKQMFAGGGNDRIKTIHVNDGFKLCSIEVRQKFPTKKLKELFKTLFNVEVTGNTIHNHSNIY